MKVGCQNHWDGSGEKGGGSHHSAGGGLGHTNTHLPCDFLSPLSPPFLDKRHKRVELLSSSSPAVHLWLQETDNRAPSKPESTVSGRLPVSGRAHTMARPEGETQRESVRQGEESARASGRCPIHPIEDTLLHLNGPLLASAGPGC